MVPADVPAAQTLTASFGWPHRREDWAFMHGLGEGIVVEHGGRIAGTALCWRFGPGWATLGLIGVAGALQGRGIGRQMVERLLERLAGCPTMLHATRAGLKLYTDLGFEPTGTVVQYQGAVSQPGMEPLAAGLRLRPLCLADLPQLLVLDRAATGMDRTALLTVLTAQPSGIVLDRAGEPVGFSLIRRFGHGQVLGPTVAPDLAGARAMAAHLLGQRTGQFVRMDLPKECGLGQWLVAQGLEDVGTVIRMVRGTCAGAEPSRGAKTFGLASQAFG